MTTPESLKRYDKVLLSEVQETEEVVSNYPFWKKVELILVGTKHAFAKEVVEECLKDYQHFMEY